MLVNAVGEKKAEFIIQAQALERCSRTRATVVTIPAKLIQGDFLIPNLETEPAVPADFVDRGVAVLGRPVFRIRVKVEKHVVDVVFQIEVVLHLFVNAIISDVAVEQTGHGIPAGTGFAHDVVLVHPPVFFSSSEMLGIPIVFDSLGQIVDAKVESVVVEVNKSTVPAGVAHIGHTLLHPDITGVLRIIRAVASAAPCVQGPGVGEAGAKHELVESFNLRVFEERIVQLGNANR